MSRAAQKSLTPSESLIQAAVLAHWLLLGLPNTLVAAVPNQKAHGQPGLTPGLADLMVLAPGLGAGFIELKKDEQSPVSDAQREFGALCRRLGISYALTFGRDQPIRVLEEWGACRRQASAA